MLISIFLMGWRPLVSFEKMLQRILEWYLEKQGWLESMIKGGKYREYYKSVCWMV